MTKKGICERLLRLVAVFLIGIFCFLTLFFDARVEAAVTGQETSQLLINTAIGRYKLNYTGNTNHYAFWNGETGQPIVNSIYNDGNMGANSSTATLTKTPGASGIKYAFLVWETRAPEGVSQSIYLRLPDGRGTSIHPAYAINDWRVVGNNPGQKSMYCMAADVTTYVQQGGYGAYTVYNIPRWYWGENGDTGGGESPGSWQLIVVEEGKDFPVRAVSLKMGAEFKLEKDYASNLIFSNGVTTKSIGTATGQIFFGASNSSSNSRMVENISTYDGSGGLISNAASNATTTAGVYRNGTLVNGRDYAAGCIRMDLSDINSGIGNRAQNIKSYIENKDWTTFFLLGTAIDIAFPDFEANQTTTVNSSTGVMVQGSIKNVSAAANTGIYDGKLVVYIDGGLNITDATAFVNGIPVPGSVSGNQVTFTGLDNLTTGNVITYAISCQPNGTGNGRYDNSDNFSGRLRADGANTGYPVDNVCISSSYALAKYKLTVNAGNGIESVSGGGDYIFGQTVNINAVVKKGYHWKNWTGNYNTAVQNYSFRMPARNVTLTANAEANEYILHFETNGGVEVTPIPDMTVHYDETVTLPDATSAYVKYTLDGVNVTADVLNGTISLSGQNETEEEPEMDGEDAVAMSQSEEDAEAAGAAEASEQDMTEQTEPGLEETPEEGERDKAAYESVYMGWATEAEKDYFEPQWTAGASLEVSALVDAMGVTEQNGATINLYAVWDDCPWIKAQTLYYSLEQAQNGFITVDEVLSHATAYDREDGELIAPGEHDDGTSFTIPDYMPTDFTQFDSEGGCTENLTVVDSAGNIYRKMIWVYIVDTAATEVLPEGTTRFINEYYYYQPYDLGGLRDDSVWKTDPEYVQTLTEAFENLKNDTPIESYYSTYEENLEMREYIDQHGFGNSKEPDALRGFYDRFMAED